MEEKMELKDENFGPLKILKKGGDAYEMDKTNR